MGAVFMQGAALWARLSASHGYFNKQGYCDGGNTLGAPSGNCHLFPVIWGETGTGFTVSPCLPQTTPSCSRAPSCDAALCLQSAVEHTFVCQVPCDLAWRDTHPPFVEAKMCVSLTCSF